MREGIRRGLRNSLKRYGRKHLRETSLKLLQSLGDSDSEWKQIYIEELKALNVRL